MYNIYTHNLCPSRFVDRSAGGNLVPFGSQLHERLLSQPGCPAFSCNSEGLRSIVKRCYQCCPYLYEIGMSEEEFYLISHFFEEIRRPLMFIRLENSTQMTFFFWARLHISDESLGGSTGVASQDMQNRLMW